MKLCKSFDPHGDIHMKRLARLLRPFTGAPRQPQPAMQEPHPNFWMYQ